MTTKMWCCAKPDLVKSIRYESVRENESAIVITYIDNSIEHLILDKPVSNEAMANFMGKFTKKLIKKGDCVVIGVVDIIQE